MKKTEFWGKRRITILLCKFYFTRLRNSLLEWLKYILFRTRFKILSALQNEKNVRNEERSFKIILNVSVLTYFSLFKLTLFQFKMSCFLYHLSRVPLFRKINRLNVQLRLIRLKIPTLMIKAQIWNSRWLSFELYFIEMFLYN